MPTSSGSQNFTHNDPVAAASAAAALAAANAAQTTANDALPKAGGQMTGNITFSGAQTVDGYDVSALGISVDAREFDVVVEIAGAALTAGVDPVKYFYYAGQAVTVLGAWVTSDGTAAVTPPSGGATLILAVQNQASAQVASLTLTADFSVGVWKSLGTITNGSLSATNSLKWVITQNGLVAMSSGIRLLVRFKTTA